MMGAASKKVDVRNDPLGEISGDMSAHFRHGDRANPTVSTGAYVFGPRRARLVEKTALQQSHCGMNVACWRYRNEAS